MASRDRIPEHPGELVLPSRKRVRAHGTDVDAERVGEDQQVAPPGAQRGGRLRERLAPAGLDLDLRGDQLAGHRFREHGVAGRSRIAQLLEARGQVEALRFEHRELLLEANREIGRRLKGGTRGVEIEVHC